MDFLGHIPGFPLIKNSFGVTDHEEIKNDKFY